MEGVLAPASYTSDSQFRWPGHLHPIVIVYSWDDSDPKEISSSFMPNSAPVITDVGLPESSEFLFMQLVKQWHIERGAMSLISEMVNCPSYQKIISMGEEAVPQILDLFEDGDTNPAFWLPALEAITGEDPVTEDMYGDRVKIAQAWLSWAKEKNVR